METLSSDSEVPTKIKDGEFMFVDEDSCIGCSNCAFYAPDSFKMLLSTGRARAYSQSRDRAGSISAALASCPVDCIKPVSFKELKLFENARENGDGRSDHKHNGRGPNNGNGTPLYVSGMSRWAGAKRQHFAYQKYSATNITNNLLLVAPRPLIAVTTITALAGTTL